MHPAHLFARRHTLGSILWLSGLALAAIGCNPYAQEARPLAGTGGLGLQLKLSSEVSVTSITYQLLHGTEFVRSGTFVPSPEGDVFAGFVGGLPQATGYALSLESNALLAGSQATTRCSGTASFGIVRGKTTTVAVRMRCEGVRGDELTAQTTPQGNSCPRISLLLAQPATARIGEPVSVEGDALDPDMMPKALSYRWSTPSGTGSFKSAVDAVTTFVCAGAGRAELVLVVSDGDTACPFESSSVTVTCSPSPSMSGLSAAGHAGIAGSAGTAAVPTIKDDGRQAPLSTAGQGSASVVMMAAPLMFQAGRGSVQAPSSNTSSPPTGTRGKTPQQPAFDAGAPSGMRPAADTPPPSHTEDPPASNHDAGKPPPTRSQPSWPSRDGGQPPEPERREHERDAGQPQHQPERDAGQPSQGEPTVRERNRERDGGWSREGSAGRGGWRRDASPHDPVDPLDAGVPAAPPP